MTEKQLLALKINIAHYRYGANWPIVNLDSVSRQLVRIHWREIKSMLEKSQILYIQRLIRNLYRTK